MTKTSFLTMVLLVKMVMLWRETEEVGINIGLLRWKCWKQKLDWYDHDKCHKAKPNYASEKYFSKLCNGHNFLRDSVNHLKPRAAEEVTKKTKRREYRCMRPDERHFFHRALRTLKTSMAGEFSEWDNFVLRHDFEKAPSAHYGPAFLGWHRHFLLSLEKAMKNHFSNAHLPYWDNRLEKRLDTYHRGSALFSKYLLGTNEGLVMDGVAANWSMVGQACQGISMKLKRSVEESNAYLFSDYDTDVVLGRDLEDISSPWNSYFEDNHGSIHMYFGAESAMGPVNCSPNDPVFFLHHCFIDKLFENFKNKMKTEGNILTYPDTSAANLPTWFVDNFDIEHTHAGNASMHPFEGLTNEEGYTSDDYTGIYYEYDTSPADITACTKDDDCCNGDKSYFLWCQQRTGKCIAKVREREEMHKDWPANACLCPWKVEPVNVDGFCSCPKT